MIFWGVERVFIRVFGLCCFVIILWVGVCYCFCCFWCIWFVVVVFFGFRCFC